MAAYIHDIIILKFRSLKCIQSKIYSVRYFINFLPSNGSCILRRKKWKQSSYRTCSDYVNISVNESFQLFKPKILNVTIRDKKKKRPDIDTIHDHIMKTEASNADKTLLENLVKELIKQNILINEKTTEGLDFLKSIEEYWSNITNIIRSNFSWSNTNFTSFTTIIKPYSHSRYENKTNNFFFKFLLRIILLVKSWIRWIKTLCNEWNLRSTK